MASFPLSRKEAPVRPALVAAVTLAALSLAACGQPAPAAAPPTPAAPPSSPAADPAGGTSLSGAQSWTMPDLVGSGLQDAQDAIQRLTDFAIVITTSHDATGRGRNQVADRNWKVCDQNVAPGATITPDTEIDFGAVMLDEEC